MLSLACVDNFNFSTHTEKEELKNIVLNFTKHLLQNKLITHPGILDRTHLISMYSDWQINNPSSIGKQKIINALKNASLLKNGKIIESGNDDVIQFKEYIFQSRIDESILRPKIRVVVNNQILYHNSLKNGLTDSAKFVCTICKIPFVIDKECDKRIENLEHKLRNHYRFEKKRFLKKFPNLKISGTEVINLEINVTETVSVTLQNVSDKSIIINKVYKIFDSEEVKTENKHFPYSLPKGEKLIYIISILFTTYGLKIFPLVFEINNETTSNSSFLLIEPQFEVLKKELLGLGPVSPYQPPSKNMYLYNLPILAGEPLRLNRSALKSGLLKKYDIPKSLNRILDGGFKSRKGMLPTDEKKLYEIRKLLCDTSGCNVLYNLNGLNEKNYAERFGLLLFMEEHQMNKEIHDYDQCDVELIMDRRKKYSLYGLEIKGLSEGRPSILKGDTVFIIKKKAVKKYEGVVHCIEKDIAYLGLHNSFQCSDREKINVEFSYNRMSLNMCHRALEQINLRRLGSFMFPSLLNQKPNNNVVLRKPFFNELIEHNEEQKEAVKNILENRAYPSPYILFGPAGTGKTATLVEAITQIWHSNKINPKNICVVTSSNSAADLITERLLKYIPSSEILRIYAFYRMDIEIPKKLRTCSNYDRITGEIFLPSKNHIRSKSILVLTPIIAGRLVTAGFNGLCFHYIFVDEAGHAIEPEMLVPIIGLLTVNERRKSLKDAIMGSLILAGDPKQLGPVIRSRLAATIGLDMSLLERLILQCKVYEKNPITHKYNPMVITKLINNYRSHEEILRVPNIRFYDNELKAKGAVENVTSACQWNKLPRKNFPLLFHGVQGKEDRESNSPSFFNRCEIQIVEDYINDLLKSNLKVTQEDIGIITPYRKQMQKLRQYLKTKNMPNIMVASVEEFQGQERKIIIISTVRSRLEFVNEDYRFGLGFLRNAKRFNVAVTRAIALLIVVGNPDILQCDPNWRALIKHCKTHDSYVGYEAIGSVPNDFDPNEKLTSSLSVLTLDRANNRK